MCIRVVRYAKRHVAPLFQVPAPDGSGEMVQGEAVSMGRSVLAVFQRGQQIWSCAAAAQVCLLPCTKHPCMRRVHHLPGYSHFMCVQH